MQTSKSTNSRIFLPFVSVVVPAYNSPHRTATCIEALLKQTYPRDRYEIIVVDNGSTDSTPQVIQQYPVISLLQDSIRSPYVARNKGIIHSQGEIIAMIDVNCIPISEWIIEGVKTMQTENADLVGGQVKFTFSEQKRIAEMYDSIVNVQIERNIRERNVTKGGNLFVKKAVFEAIGPFPLHRSGGDVLWTGKVTRQGYKLVYAPRALVTYPARGLMQLIKKQFRVGRGQIGIWLEEKMEYGKIIDLIIRDFLPPKTFSIWKIVEERGADDIKRKFRLIWFVAYICHASMSLGRVFFLFERFILCRKQNKHATQ